jgi:hypothetical protein
LASSEQEIIAKLGPLAGLAGTWEGAEGLDEAPAEDLGLMRTPYRERAVFVPMGPVDNHQLGYWLWDAEAGQVMRAFLVPRGVTVLAGGRAVAADRKFRMLAVVGSETFGIASNPFLDVAFKTVRYELEVDLEGTDRFRYAEDTQLLLKGRSEVFHHRDSNTLRRVR